MMIKLKPIAAAVALSLATGSVWAQQTFYIAAKAYTKTLPDGSTVPMWGYVEDTGGTCWNAATNPDRMTCINGLGTPTLPGPRLTVPVGEDQVRIFLSNGLPEPTSIMIPGQEMPWSNNNNGPTWNDNSVGPRTAPTQRVRSFGREAAPNGGRRPYVWNNFRETTFTGNGSFIYTSATWPQKQVYMGLAGMLTRDATAAQPSTPAEVFPGVPYDNDVVLFYSDLDPAFNQAVVDGTLQTAVDRHPTWFLVNGEPYETGFGDIANGTNGPLTAGENTLLRFASTAMDTHVEVVQGMDMTIHGEDGIQYRWEDTAAGTSGTAPRKQYSVMMTPAKTKDAIVVAPGNNRYAVYDGDGYMTNPSDPNNEAVGDSLGGMLRFLSFGSSNNLLPVASADTNSATQGGAVISGNVLTNDTAGEAPTAVSAADQGGTAITLGAAFATAGGNSLTLNGDGSYSYTPTNPGVEVFNYTITDGTGDTSSSTLTITVGSANVAPVAVDQTVVTDEDVALAITLAATDANGDPLTYSNTAPANGVLSGTAPNLTYTPNANFNGADSFTFTANDGTQDSTPATVSITVTPVNDAPVADAQSATTDAGVAIPVTLTGSDVDGDALTFAVATPPTGGTLSGTAPNLTYTPNAGFSGADSFTFVANDATVDSLPATVDITVNSLGNAGPTIVFSTAGAGSVPGVSGPYDDADVYSVAVYDPETNNQYSRLYDAISDMGLPNNADIDGISVNGTTIYVSFAAASTNINGLDGATGNVAVPDEDVIAFDTTSGTWSTYFDGSVCGLDASNGQDVDAVSVSGGTLYFSIAGGGNRNPVGGVNGVSDDADIYSWSGGTTGTANCSKVIDARNGGLGLQGNADIDGLSVVGGTYYMSFRSSTNVPAPVGTVQDEWVVSYDGANWAPVFTGTGQLDGSNSQNVDAIDVQ